jgi:hypothetical protein
MAKPRSYQKPEPTVIDEALILAAVAEQDKWAQEHDEIVPNPPLKPAEIKTLALSFKSEHQFRCCPWQWQGTVVIQLVADRLSVDGQPGLLGQLNGTSLG